jgi:hypothetical protein
MGNERKTRKSERKERDDSEKENGKGVRIENEKGNGEKRMRKGG